MGAFGTLYHICSNCQSSEWEHSELCTIFVPIALFLCEWQKDPFHECIQKYNEMFIKEGCKTTIDDQYVPDIYDYISLAVTALSNLFTFVILPNFLIQSFIYLTTSTIITLATILEPILLYMRW